MISKTKAAPIYGAGDYAELECARTGALRGHFYSVDLAAWSCTCCGGLTRPEKPPTVLRPDEDAVSAPAPQRRVTGVRIQPVGEAAYTLPVEPGSLLVIAPMGTNVQPPEAGGVILPAYTIGLSELERVTAVVAKAKERS